MSEGSLRRKRARGKVTGFEELEQGLPMRIDVEAEYGSRRIPVSYAPVPAVTPRRPTTPPAAPHATQPATQVSYPGDPSGSGAPVPHPPDPQPASDAAPGDTNATSGGTSGRKATHVAMNEFLGRKERILNILFSLEVDPRVHDPCKCGSAGLSVYRCTDCVGIAPCCSKCMQQAHVHNPLHRIQRWCGSYFARDNLDAVGVRLCLGHDGSQCPNTVGKKPKPLVVVHTNGVHRVQYFSCECAPLVPAPDQLLAAGFYPATWDQPATVFTIKLLEHYHLNSVQSRISAHDYWALLRRLTDNTRDGCVPPRYEELLRVSREWRVLKRLKRSGQALGIADLLPAPSLSVAIRCPACPQPGINLPDNWQDDVTEDNLHEYTVYIGIDGNFKAVRKTKRQDPDDKALLDGLGYFVNTDEYDEWMGKNCTDAPEEHDSTCANLKSMKILSARTGISVAGLVAIFCRHGLYCPNTIIDLEVGEKFRILDYALFMALSRDPNGDLNWILTCDKGCQYGVNLKRRFEETLPATPAIERVKVLVPKFHLQGHNEECRYKFSLNYTKHCGRTDGEYVERPWQHSNHTAVITRDMNPGHRHDTYEDCNGDWNYGKLITLASFVLRKLKEAYTGREEAVANYDALTAATTAEQRATWEKMPREPYKKDGWLHSIYRADRRKMPTYDELLIALQQAGPGGEHQPSHIGKLLCPKTFIALGLSIEEQQIALKTSIAGLPQDPTARSREQTMQLSLHRAELRDELSKFRAMQQVHMPALGPTFVTEDYSRDIDEDYGFPEDDTLDMPSTWGDAAVRERHGFTKLADIERMLRCGKAATALAGVRVAMQLYSSFKQEKLKNISGQTLETRAAKALRAQWRDVDQHAVLYRRQYAALERLGLSAEDATRFKPLLDSDLNDLRGGAAHIEKVGDSRRKHAWFWGGDRDPDDDVAKELDTLTDEELRVRWFRAGANRDRFKEEVEIGHAELQRVVKTHQHMKSLWDTLACRHAASAATEEDGRLARASLGQQAYALKQAAICSQREAEALRCVQDAELLRSGAAAKGKTRGIAGKARYEWSYY